jgi:uncharacterized membrane protein YgcG
MRRLPFSLALFAFIAGNVLAVAPTVQDGGKYFSPEAIKKADEQLRELYAKNHWDLLVETFESAPADQLEKVKAMSKAEREKFFQSWARTRVEQRAVNGVYVIVCKDPTYIYVEVTPKAIRALDAASAKKLKDRLIADFSANKFDEGLAATVKLVREKLGGK